MTEIHNTLMFNVSREVFSTPALELLKFPGVKTVEYSMQRQYQYGRDKEDDYLFTLTVTFTDLVTTSPDNIVDFIRMSGVTK